MKNLVVSVLLLLAGIASADPEGVSPFYSWDESIPDRRGALLRQEPLEPSLVLANAAASTRILYVSQGWNRENVTVSGAVFLPKGVAPKGGWPVLAWSHGTVGVADVCAPSFAGRSTRDVTYLNHWLAKGYAIVATDYEGLGTAGPHSYLHCRAEAYGNIDAVRAARQLGAPISTRWLVAGQSQGGQGALCTGALAAEHAPELEFLGTLATAPGVNFLERFAAGQPDDPNPFLGIALLLARGFETYEPEFDANATFSDAALALAHHTSQMCISELVGLGMQADLTVGQSFDVHPFSEAPGVRKAAAKMEIPPSGWNAPVYIAQGTDDEMVRAQDTYRFANALCEQEVAVTLDVFPGADHSGPMNQGVAKFSRWADARLADKPAGNNCDEIKSLVEAAAR